MFDNNGSTPRCSVCITADALSCSSWHRSFMFLWACNQSDSILFYFGALLGCGVFWCSLSLPSYDVAWLKNDLCLCFHFCWVAKPRMPSVCPLSFCFCGATYTRMGILFAVATVVVAALYFVEKPVEVRKARVGSDFKTSWGKPVFRFLRYKKC